MTETLCVSWMDKVFKFVGEARSWGVWNGSRLRHRDLSVAFSDFSTLLYALHSHTHTHTNTQRYLWWQKKRTFQWEVLREDRQTNWGTPLWVSRQPWQNTGGSGERHDTDQTKTNVLPKKSHRVWWWVLSKQACRSSLFDGTVWVIWSH